MPSSLVSPAQRDTPLCHQGALPIEFHIVTYGSTQVINKRAGGITPLVVERCQLAEGPSDADPPPSPQRSALAGRRVERPLGRHRAPERLSGIRAGRCRCFSQRRPRFRVRCPRGGDTAPEKAQVEEHEKRCGFAGRREPSHKTVPLTSADAVAHRPRRADRIPKTGQLCDRASQNRR